MDTYDVEEVECESSQCSDSDHENEPENLIDTSCFSPANSCGSLAAMAEWSMVRPLPVVIGLLGVSGTGKTSLSNYLRDHYGYTKLCLASPLKESCHTLFGFAMNEMTDPDLKNVPSANANSELTPRQAMQYMTAALGRVDQGNLLRLNLGRRMRASEHKRIVVSDLRFPEDVKYLREEFGAVIFGMRREKRYAPSSGKYESPGIMTHLPWAMDPSEACVDLRLADMVLDNNGDVGVAHLAEIIIGLENRTFANDEDHH